MSFTGELSDLFSPVTRALTKYSYGTSKVTSRRLQILMEAPWKIFEQTKEQKEDTKMWEFNANPSSELEITRLFSLRSTKLPITVRLH